MAGIVLWSVLVFFTALAAAVLFLYLSAYIPQDKVRRQFQKSADLMCENNVFFCAYQNTACSKIDRYADSILLNIAWNLKPDMRELMWAPYYHDDLQNENDSLRDTVYNGKEANLEYVRYWHGSAAVVRILHLFLNIRQIYILHATLLVLLTGVLLTMLITKGMRPEAVALGAGMIGINVWFVPMSLEYYWTFLCMLAASILVIRWMEKGKEHRLWTLFLATGMLTAYLDFLSTETITLTVPLLLAFRYEAKKAGENAEKHPAAGKAQSTNEKKEHAGMLHRIRRPFGMCVFWGIGYVGMWVLKWILASYITCENVLPYVKGHVEERIGSGIAAESLPFYLIRTIRRNLSCLFPAGYGPAGVAATATILLIVCYIGFVYYNKENGKKKLIENAPVYILIMMIPYVRYLVLHNHAFLHCFFTYRAQIAVIMTVCLMLYDITDFRHIKKRRAGRS